jgi:hypothetical protein
LMKRAIANPAERGSEAAGPRVKKPRGIDVKQAVAKAMEYIKDLIPNAPGLTLEEVERSGPDWLVTLGYLEKNVSPIAALAGGSQKTYKVFRIDAATGEVVSMKIRKP